MKCQIPEISWHNRDPVLSIDLQPINKSRKENFHRLASGGSDTHVLIWYVVNDDSGSVDIEIAADLTRHQRAVNAVRWSPSGDLLASGDDESVIFLWKMKEESETLNILDNTNDGDKEIWLVHKILRGHMEDVYDLSWSPNSLHLISGSVDNTAIVWDVVRGKQTNILQEAKGFVQGVAWDPKNQFLATLSTDRYCRVYDSNSKKVLSKNNKCLLPFPSTSSLHGKVCRLYHDDTLQTFFRRLCFSPDGMLLVAPSGVVDIDNVNDKSTKKLHTTYIYTRNSWRQPAIVLPSPDQYTVVVKFSPVLYKLRSVDEGAKISVIPLPYRMIFAVATKCSIFLYDTQQPVPFGSISNIHYTRLTDMTWSNDGKILLVSSTDGFCSVITFGEGELGEVFVSEKETTPKDKEKNKSDEKKTEFNNKAELEIKGSKVLIPEKNVTIQIPADKIIRSDEKFESPEKKNKPVTPIAIRRHPRTVDDSDRTPKEQKNVKLSFEGAVTPSTPKSEMKNTNRNSPKPIAIRRYPRNNMPQTSAATLNPPGITSPSAVDCWPTPLTDDLQPSNCAEKPTLSSDISPKMDAENTEDIRLVYDEDADMEECSKTPRKEASDSNIIDDNGSPSSPPTKATTAGTPKEKTPRRVEFRTISTPKSKKKLL